MCGAVRYETTGAPVKVLNCHCQSCREHTGAPMATLSVFKADQVSFSGDARRIYSSSPGIGRAFCATCGTSLTWEADLGSLGPVCALHISTSDNPEALQPVAHTFYAERIAWFDAADTLPRYEGMSMDSSIMRHGPATGQASD
jgi:hypothetical protein